MTDETEARVAALVAPRVDEESEEPEPSPGAEAGPDEDRADVG